MTVRALLLGSSFHLSSGGEAGGAAWTAWGRVAKGVAPLQLAFCWSHARRRLREIHDSSGSEIAAAHARDKGTRDRLMRRLARVDLLVLDDWGLRGFSAEGRRDLLEIADARHGRRSTLIASQIPVESWPEVIGEPTIADAVLDRMVHNAYRIDLKGESQRKCNRPPPLGGGNDK